MPPFLRRKKKKGNKEKKERLSKRKLLKSFYQDQIVTVLASVSWPLHFEIDICIDSNDIDKSLKNFLDILNSFQMYIFSYKKLSKNKLIFRDKP